MNPNLIIFSLHTLVHVLCSTPSEFEKMEEKQKLPKPRLTQDVKQIILSILKKRLSRYSTTLEASYSDKSNDVVVLIDKKKKKIGRRKGIKRSG